MTDKQIIIDGVDVAKCRCFTSEWDFNNCGHICKGTECKYKRLWYKKQLKRKEQECKELRTERKNLKWDLENNIQVKNHAMEEINQLKQTLTEIKELLLKTPTDSQMHCVNAKSVILQKISECEVENDK